MLRSRMAYCGPRGIELDAFLKWSQSSQDAALEWQAYENRRCRQCGYHPDESPDGVHAHVHSCPGCAARARVQRTEAAKEDGGSVGIADGPIHQCDRCRAQAQANLPHPTPPGQRPVS